MVSDFIIHEPIMNKKKEKLKTKAFHMDLGQRMRAAHTNFMCECVTAICLKET